MPKTAKIASRKTVRYEPVLNLPALPYEEFMALRSNIAVNGVLVPILVDNNGPIRNIIDGNNRKVIADELGYECPEVLAEGLTEEEKRTLARALNMARRQFSAEQKRQLIADQLHETPDRSNRWLAKQLGVSHPTVAAVRNEMEGTGRLFQFDRTQGEDGKYRPVYKPMPLVHRSPAERQTRINATTLIQGDCRTEMKKLAAKSLDTIICDPIYPEVKRAYGRITEQEWHALMHDVVKESRRVLKPKGSAVFIVQPNYEKIGQMRLWLWEFVVWAGREWNLVQDAWWWCVDAMPLVGTGRKVGLMRQSVKMCIWLGPPDCYRNQDNVLWTPSDATSARRRSDIALREGRGGRTYRNSTISGAAAVRGGTTPMNCLPIPCGGGSVGSGHHPAATPYEVAAWWCRYILPPGGTLMDMMCGSGTMLQAGLDHGAGKVIGIERQAEYVRLARKRIEES